LPNLFMGIIVKLFLILMFFPALFILRIVSLEQIRKVLLTHRGA
jgi:hypothetical protein